MFHEQQGDFLVPEGLKVHVNFRVCVCLSVFPRSSERSSAAETPPAGVTSEEGLSQTHLLPAGQNVSSISTQIGVYGLLHTAA